MHINLSKYPSLRKTYAQDMPKLSGGLNIWELDYRIGQNQSPFVKNLWWQDGAIQSRNGQTYISDTTDRGVGYTCASNLFWDKAFFHIGTKIYYGDPSGASLSLTDIGATVPANRGTFFRYDRYLFYKNKGGFFKISYNAGASPAFSCVDVTANAYVPITYINMDPDTHAGDIYQPENRLSARKTLWYNAKQDVTEYHLPVAVDSIIEVTVDGTVTTGYTLNAAKDMITFNTAPPVTTPATNNTVHITYSKSNSDTYNAVMSCPYAIVAGGDTDLCILLGGCEAQPNAVFWNSNDAVSMNASYWPVEYYNLVDDAEDPVSGFGKQYHDLIVFKDHSVGKLTYGTQTINDRDYISFTYQSINAKTGCDLPWTIQLIENTLVFCNTYQGVHYIQSSSAAYENNVISISKNVNGATATSSRTPEVKGLLYDVRNSTTPVTSYDDDYRYWLCANGKVYLWDYSLSSASDPSWFYFTDIGGVAYFSDETHRSYHLNASGRVTRFERTFNDYGGAIDKVYQFPTMSFDSFDKLKDILYLIFSVRADTETTVKTRYDCDYMQRDDPVDIKTWDWTTFPFDITGTVVGYSSLTRPVYAKIVKKVPGLFHVRHFSFRLSNNVANQDLAIIEATVYYRFTEKER